MHNIAYIITNIILPIFLQVAAGYLLQKAFRLDISGLVKIQFYIITPALLFVNIYAAELDASLLLAIVLLNGVLFALLYLLGWLGGKGLGYAKGRQSAFVNSVCLYNSGNYCIPLIQLLYNQPFAYSVQIIVMLTQAVLTNTVGLFNASLGTGTLRQAIRDNLRMPMLYSVLIAGVMRYGELAVAKPLWSAMQVLAQGMVPLALITLGAQLANTRIRFRRGEVYLSNVLRLLGGPLLAWGLVWLWGMEGVVAQVIIICAAAPTAVSAVLLAMEYGNEPEFASQAVFTSTLLSVLTVPVIITLVMTAG